MSGAGEPPRPAAESEALGILESTDSFALDRYTIVADYVRYDDRTRGILGEARQRIVGAFEARARAPTNLLLWGVPGTGKSHLVHRIAENLATRVEFRELNLGQVDESTFRSSLDALRTVAGPILCFIDEVDSKPTEAWPYEALLPVLEPAVPRADATCFCLAGSVGATMGEMKERIRARPKGPDLLSRIPRGNEYVVDPLGVGDRMLVALAQLLGCAEEEGRVIREVEKLALYYIATQPALASARQLRALAYECARRLPPGEDRLKYDHLFRAGDPENKEFWNRSEPVRAALSGRFAHVAAARPTTDRSRAVRTLPGLARRREDPASRGLRVAVLPLVNISPDPGDGYFADGLTEELISTISRLGGLSVIARTSVMRYRGSAKSASEIARELEVGTLLEGSVRKAGGDLRITVQLVDVDTEAPLWSETYERHLENVFAIQGDIARRVAEALQVQVLGASGPAAPRPARNVAAYEHYLKGREYWWRRGEPNYRLALLHYEKAIELDPTFALAYCGIADTHALLGNTGYVPLPDAIQRAEVAARKAIQLDPTLSEAHVSLAPVLYNRYDWPGALRELRRAIELDPNNLLAHFWCAITLQCQGMLEEGLSEAYRAVELDPLSLGANNVVGACLYMSRQFAAAIAQFRKTNEILGDPGQLHHLIAFAYLAAGETERAVESSSQWVDDGRRSPAVSRADYGAILARAGRRDEARTIARELIELSRERYVPAGAIGLVFVGLGENDRAFEWFERAYAERSAWVVEDLKVNPFLDPIRSDPRFPALLRRFHFAPAVGPGTVSGPTGG